MKLRPHQTEALQEIKNHEKGIVHLPTGSGKTRIIYGAVCDDILSVENGDYGVYVVIAPKLLLVEQLLKEAKQQLFSKGIQAFYHVVGSGNISSNTRDSDSLSHLDCQELSNILSIQISSSTRTSEITKKYLASRVANDGNSMPLIIISTYDSAGRIQEANLPHINQIHYDEAHYLLRLENHPLIDVGGRAQLVADKTIFYTATLKNTLSDTGRGMNNKLLFGDIIYFKPPAEIIASGDIIRPRMHIVDTTSAVDATNVLEADASAVIAAFKEHRFLINTGPKMLVVTKGTTHLNDLVSCNLIQNLLLTRPNLKIFDITSNYGARINSVEVTRKEFLRQLNALTDADEAIIFHVRILTEGIDVSGITGVMFMTEPDSGLGDILQNLGRATRLHIQDRKNIHETKLIKPEEVDKMVKPYAWIVVPSYGSLGPDLEARLRDIVYSIRDYNFVPEQDVFIRDSKGEVPDSGILGVNTLGTLTQTLQGMVSSIIHDIEKKEEADALILRDEEITHAISLMSEDELIDNLPL